MIFYDGVCHNGAYFDRGLTLSENMLNRSKGDYAYTILDVVGKATDKAVSEIAGIDGIIKVRVITD